MPSIEKDLTSPSKEISSTVGTQLEFVGSEIISHIACALTGKSLFFNCFHLIPYLKKPQRDYLHENQNLMALSH